jgi:hypothetical protein
VAATPDLAPGVVEQAIYTWSTVNLGGVKGVGFGAVSPGLRSDDRWLRWLEAWPSRKFEPFSANVSPRDAFSGWRGAITHGAFAFLDWNVVFRKIPYAGEDGSGRDRFVVHALFGRREDLDLSRVASDAAIWRDAEQFPLDRLPRLETVSVSDLEPRSLEHADDVEDPQAKTLLTLLREGNGRTVLGGVPASEVDAALRAAHIAVPTTLWPDLEVVCYVGRDGIDVEIAVDQGRVGVSSRSAKSALAGCRFHREVDAKWNRSSSWRDFLAAPAKFVAARSPDDLEAAADLATSAAAVRVKPREAFRQHVAARLGTPNWRFDTPVEESALPELLMYPADALGSWIEGASKEDLRVVLAAAREPELMRGIGEHIARSSLETRAIVKAWQSSGVAVLAIASLRRPSSQHLEPWAAPDGDADERADDLDALARVLVRLPEQCIVFFSAGIVHDRAWRRAMIEALLRAGARRGYVFDDLLAGAGASDRDYCEVALDHLDDFSDWLRLPDTYRAAFREGLRGPSWLSRLRARR